MGYIKTNWKDQKVKRPKTYEFQKNSDGTYTLLDSFGQMEELGTPVNAFNMNKIEEGIDACAIRKYNSKETFSKGEWVVGESEGEKTLFESLKDENKGKELTDEQYWKKINFGGGNTDIDFATKDKAGIVKPDNETTFVDEDGTIHAPKYDLFDIVVKDHELTFEESKGLAKLGSYVYKSTKEHNQYGYPDFYAKCLEEYEDESNTSQLSIYTSVTLNDGSKPVSEDGIFSGFSTSHYLIMPKPFAPETTDSWEMVFKIRIPDTVPQLGAIIGNSTNEDFQGLFLAVNTSKKLQMNLTSNGTSWDVANDTASTNVLTSNTWYYVRIKGTWNNDSNTPKTTYVVDVSTDNQEWTEYLRYSNTSPIHKATIPYALGLDNIAGSDSKPFCGEIDLKESCIKVTNSLSQEEEFWNGNQCDDGLIKVNKNGHKYYDVTNTTVKEYIDKLYTDTGVAWYYGIDERAERVFLPRRDERVLIDKKEPTSDDPTWYNLYSDGWLEQGGSLKSSSQKTVVNLPVTYKDVNYSVTACISDESGAAETGAETAVGFKTPSSFTFGVSEGYGGYQTIMWNANGYADIASLCSSVIASEAKQSLSPSLRGNEVTKQSLSPSLRGNEVTEAILNRYHYMVTGNTTVSKAQTEAVDVTASQNDTMPLFTGLYFDFKPNHVSWLKAGTVANKSTYLSAYNELVNIASGSEQKYGEGFKVVKSEEKDDHTDYSEYWILDESAETFRTPLKTSLLNTISNARILIDKKEPTSDDPTWYNLYSDGWLEQGGLAENMKANEQRTINLLQPYANTCYSVFHSTQTTNTLDVWGYGIKIINPASNSFILYINSSVSGDVAWKTEGYAQAPSVEQIADSENIGLYFKIGNAVENIELLDAGQILEDCVLKSQLKEAQAVIETFTEGTSGYRIWSDGYCEQWCYKNWGDTGSFTFLKPFKDINWILTFNGDGADITSNLGITARTNKGFDYNNYTTTLSGSMFVCGYLEEGTY